MLRVVSTKHNTGHVVPEHADVVTSIRLTRDQHEQLKARAASEHRTVSQEMRRMVEHYLRPQAQEAA